MIVPPRTRRGADKGAPSVNENDASAALEMILAIAVGNTRTRVGVLKGSECLKAQSLRSDEPGEIADFAHALTQEFRFPQADPVIVISTVSGPTADAIEAALGERFSGPFYRFGRDLELPISHTLTESGERTVGQDRLLCAIGAFDVVKQACVVIDMGTAITVDFVDGEGVFHGGAIMPGVAMMFDAMHERTAQLPRLAYKKPDEDSHAPGNQTDEAMQLGVTACVRGAIRFLAERYAEFYEGYPQIIATGGDMGVLEGDELIEAFVPDLQLHGIRAACRLVLDEDDGAGDEDADSDA